MLAFNQGGFHMAISENDFLKVSFSVFDGDRMVETTREDEAKKAGIYDANMKYKDSLIILSDQHIIKGFRNALKNSKENEESKAEIKSADAFGSRKEELVRLVPLQRFSHEGISPAAGMPVSLDGARGRVQSVSGGRVRVDLNHELAGKDVVYNFKITKCISSSEEKLNALLSEYLELENAATLKDGIAEISVPQDALMKEDYLNRKYAIVDSAMLFVPEIKNLRWIENFDRKETKS